MENIEIDRKLAEVLHPKWYLTTVTNGKTKKTWKQFVDPKTNELVDWNPSEDMGSAWEVAEQFGLTDLNKGSFNHWLADFGHEYFGVDKEAALAICKGAMMVIEGGKSDE